MSNPSILQGDLVVQGSLTVANGNTVNLPAGQIVDASVPSGANISADKLQSKNHFKYSQIGTAANVAEIELGRCVGATAVIQSVVAGVIGAATGNAVVTVNVLKNGTTVLSGNISIANTTLAYGAVTGTISVQNMVAGDVLSATIVTSAGTGALPTGVFIEARVKEDSL